MENLAIDYIAYVEEQIKLFNEISTLHRDKEITPELINKALATYEQVNIGLIGEYNRAKINEYETRKRYEKWYDKTFSEVRKAMIKEVGDKPIKISVKEYETQLRVEHEEEYWKWQDAITIAENKTSFLLRLVEGWKKYDSILVTLSHNMRSEMFALSLDNRINSDRDTIRAFPKRGS